MADSRQFDLFGQSSDVPRVCEDHLEPALWVRRLVVWHDPHTIARDLAFRRGLNIIWTPDDGDVASDALDDAVHIGHGAGKTMLCRFLRYCMCEAGFRGSQLHRRIRERFPHGFVGAELVVGGHPWAVIRPIGDSQADYVGRGMTLEGLWDMGPSDVGVTPLLEAIRSSVLRDLQARTIPGRQERIDWSHALAWLTRDQECRFHGVLAWRGTSLEAKSPVLHNYSHDAKTYIARALLGLITEEEAHLRVTHDQLVRERQRREAKDKSLRFVTTRQVEGLARDHDLGVGSLPPGPLLVRQVQEIARTRLRATTDASVLTELQAQRMTILREQDDRSSRLRQASREAARHAEAAELQRKARKRARHDLSTIETLRDEILEALPQDSPDRVHVTDALQARCDAFQGRVDTLTSELRAHQRDAETFDAEITLLSQAHERGREEGQALMRDLDRERTRERDAHYRARRLLDECERLDATTAELEENAQALTALVADIKESSAALGDLRERHRARLARFSTLFEGIVQRLIGEEARGDVRMDGRGLDVSLFLGGRRVSAALESLKVVAFDLAALLATLEGNASLPGFLLHDSPREADMGQSLYDRLFELVHELAHATPEPAFQYIITTTTAPPPEFRERDVVVRMRGTPTSERLLKVDL